MRRALLLSLLAALMMAGAQRAHATPDPERNGTFYDCEEVPRPPIYFSWDLMRDFARDYFRACVKGRQPANPARLQALAVAAFIGFVKTDNPADAFARLFVPEAGGAAPASDEMKRAIQMYHALLMDEGGRSPDAIRAFEAIEQAALPPLGTSQETAVEAGSWRAFLLARARRHAEAVQLCDVWLAQIPGDNTALSHFLRSRLLYIKVEALRGLGQPEAVLALERAFFREFPQAIDKPTRLFAAYVIIARMDALVRLGQSGQALVASEQARQILTAKDAPLAPDVTVGLFHWRHAAFETSGRADEAAREAETLLAFLTGEKYRLDVLSDATLKIAFTVLHARGHAHEARGDWRGALAWYDRIAAALRQPSDLRGWQSYLPRQRGWALHKLGQSERALLELDHAIALAREINGERTLECLNALAIKARLLEETGQKPAAATLYGEVVRLGPPGGDADPQQRMVVANAMTRVAVAQAEAGERDRAIATYGVLLARFGRYSDLHSRRAMAQSLLNRGALLANIGKPMEALGDFQAVISLHGSQPDPHMREMLAQAELNLGHIQLKLNRLEEARATLSAFLGRYAAPSSPVPRAMLIEARRYLDEARRPPAR